MRRGRRTTDEELDAIGAEPQPGEVWWCAGAAIGLNDGGKTRPALVLSVAPDAIRIIPLTSRKPEGQPVAVTHRGGLSWMAGDPRTVSRSALLSSLGPWTGFGAWRRRG